MTIPPSYILSVVKYTEEKEEEKEEEAEQQKEENNAHRSSYVVTTRSINQNENEINTMIFQFTDNKAKTSATSIAGFLLDSKPVLLLK
jgi:hypothetical protein